jgi:tetratricopeptide (TPR) repeat protein
MGTSAGRLIGRDNAITNLRRAVAPGRVVAVTGAPGVGKSALIAETLRDRERVAWIDVDHARTAEDLWAALGRGLGVTLDQAERASSRLGRALQGVAVVVIDSAELLDEDAWKALDRLRRDGPQVAWVVGSVVGNEIADVQLQVEPLAAADARALLLARAADQALGRPIDEADPAWTTLAERLDGLPLAIRLAASRLALATPQELLQRLDVVLRGGDDRRHSVQGALRFAWSLLGDREKRAVVELSPLRGGFTLPIAEGLLGDDAIVVLDALRARSAVVLRNGRLRVLEGLRRIAAEQADEDVRARFVAFWGREAARLRQMNVGTETVAGAKGLLDEHENLRAAYELAVPRDPVAAVHLAIALVNGVRIHGPLWELESLGDLRAVAFAGPPWEGAELLSLVGGAQVHVGQRRRAKTTLEEALALADAAGPDVNGRAVALCELGWLDLLDGDVEGARARFQGALDVARHPAGAALALNRLGVVELMSGNRDAAARALEAALDRLADFPHLRLRGTARMNLGSLRAEQGRHGQAEDLLQRATEDLREIEPTGYATGLVNLALLRIVMGDVESAQAPAREGMEIHLAYGSEIVAGQAGIAAALERWAAGDHRGSRELLVQSAARLESLDPRGAATARAWRAALDADTKRPVSLGAELDAALADGADPSLVAVLRAFGGAPLPPAPAAEALELQVARRLLDRTPAALRLDRSGRWFERPGDRVDLARRGSLRRILAALVSARVEKPGAGLTVSDLFEAGWPGEKALPDAAAARVYNAVRELRALGVGEVLRREAEGYLLDPAVRLEVQD